MNRNLATLSGTLLIFIGIVSAVVSQQVSDNYIVPRATLDVGRQRNRSAAGHKRKCETNLDCKGFVNSQCCRTISGFRKCRTKCRKQPKFKFPEHKKYPTNQITWIPPLAVCNVDSNKVYKEGDIVKAKDGCNKCMCSKGEMMCTKMHCPPAKCRYKNGLYDDGYHLVLLNGCKRCVCQQNVWNCTSHPCEELKMGNSALSVTPSIVMVVISSPYIFWSALR